MKICKTETVTNFFLVHLNEFPSAGEGREREKCLKVKILLCTSLMFSILGSLALYKLNVINFMLSKQFCP